MIRTALILSVVAISVSGCAGIVDDPYLVETKFSYSKPRTSQKQADADWAKCQKENLSDPDRGGMNAAEKRLAEQCMKAKGYTITDSVSDAAKVVQPAN